jgi:hypothetical protein
MSDDHWILALYERYRQLYGEIPLNTPSQSPAMTQERRDVVVSVATDHN